MSICPRCHTSIEEIDCYCRHCGKALRPRMGFWYSHSGVLLLTLIVGPFSLICVWLSRKMSLLAKWLWTAGIILFSIYLVLSLYRVALLLKEMLFTILSF